MDEDEKKEREQQRRNASLADLDAGINLTKAGEWGKAFAAYKRAADAGNADAMSNIGGLYINNRINYDGKTGETNLQRAVVWLDKAIAAGQLAEAPRNMVRVGENYDNGNGVTKDVFKAHQCYVKAALAGNIKGMYNAGCNFLTGCGTATDWQSARDWLKAVAARATEDDELAARAKHNLTELDREEQRQWQQGDGGGSGSDNGKMTRAQALEVIDLPEDSTPETIKAKWTRLMQQNHPDRGGSNFFAKHLNEARAVLGF